MAKNQTDKAEEAVDGTDPLGTDKGYIGTKADPFPNEAYSQETDPTTSPGAAETRDALAKAELDARDAA